MNSPLRCVTLSALVSMTLVMCWTNLLPAQESKGDWTQFRGPGGLGVSPDKKLPVYFSQEQGIVWKRELPGAGTSTPIVVGKRIFLTSYSGYNVPGESGGSQEDLTRHVLCLNRADGKIVWDKTVESQLPEQDNIRDGHGYASSSLAIDKDQIYAFFGKSGVFAFDHAGKQLWHADVGSDLNGWGSAASPVLHGDLVIVNASVESQSLVALDKQTGDEVWRVSGINESWNTPILIKAGGRTELVLAIQGKVLAFDPKSGDQLWSCNTDIGWYMVPSLVADKGVVYCIGGRSGIAALAVRAGGKGDVTDSHRLWTGDKGSNVSSPIFHAGHLYWMNDNRGEAYCADAKTGDILYQERIEGADQVYASAVLADGKLYYVSRSGRIFVVAAQPEFELLTSNELRDGGTFNSGFAVAGGRLYLRSDKALYCIGK